MKIKGLFNGKKVELVVATEAGQHKLMATENFIVKYMTNNELSIGDTFLYSFCGKGFRVVYNGKYHWAHNGFMFDKFPLTEEYKELGLTA